MTEVSNINTTSGEPSEEPSEEPSVHEEVIVKKISNMADSGDWNDPSTLEKTYQTVYNRPAGLIARIGKTLGFIVFFILFGIGVTKAVPALFRAILGIKEP